VHRTDASRHPPAQSSPFRGLHVVALGLVLPHEARPNARRGEQFREVNHTPTEG